MSFVFPSVLIIVLINTEVLAQTSDNGMLPENVEIPVIYKCSHSLNSDVVIPPKFLITDFNNAFRTTQNQNSHDRFRLLQKQEPVSCNNTILKLHLNSSQAGKQTQLFINNGHFLLQNDNTTLIMVTPENFCISEITAEKLELHVCPPTDFLKGQYLQKCCPLGSVLSKNLNKNIECLKVPENVSLPLRLPKILNMPEDVYRDAKDILIENCNTNFSKIHIQDYYLVEDVLPNQHILEGPVSNSSTQCADLFRVEESSGNTSWKLARVSCKTDIDVERTPSIGPTRQNYLYKCSGNEHLSFLQIPDVLQMRYSSDMMHYFQTSSNYTSPFDFSLVEREPNCSGETFHVEVSTQKNITVVDNKTIQLNFTPDGYVAYMATFMIEGEEKTDEIYYPRENFCISRITPDSISLKLCKSKCFHNENEKGRNVCIPKCCYFGAVMQSYSDGIGCGYAFNDAWVPDFYKNELTDEKINIYPAFHFHDDGQIKAWNCSQEGNDTALDLAHIKSDYRILSDGRVLTRKPGNNYSHLSWEEVFTGEDPTEFCIDAYWDTSKSYSPQNTDVYVHRCKINRITYEKTKALEDRLEKALVSTKILLFTVYLPCAAIYLLILVVYISLWDKQNVQGWTVMAFATSQFFVYIFLCVLLGATVFGSLADALLKSKFLCVFTGIMHYFFLISTFTWTLLLTFDLWAQLNSRSLTSPFYKGKKRFFGYACFALGVPTLTVIIASAVEFSFLDNTDVLVPGFRKTCLISEKLPFVLYVVGVNGSLFTVNLIFGFLTFKSLWDAKQNVKSLKTKSNSTSSTFENKAALVGKLMMLMGFVLIFEIFYKYTNLHQVSIWFNVLESYRLFHAIGLFWIFVCSAKTLKQLRKTYPELPFWSMIGTKEITRKSTETGATTMVDAASTAL